MKVLILGAGVIGLPGITFKPTISIVLGLTLIRFVFQSLQPSKQTEMDRPGSCAEVRVG